MRSGMLILDEHLEGAALADRVGLLAQELLLALAWTASATSVEQSARAGAAMAALRRTATAASLGRISLHISSEGFLDDDVGRVGVALLEQRLGALFRPRR